MSRQTRSNRLAFIKTLLILCLLAGVVWYLVRDFSNIGKGTDFPDFYTAAQMVRSGEGTRLFDPVAQAAFQARYTGRRGSLYIHPPFEVLLYLPFCLGSMQRAYLVWTVFNTALLLPCAFLLENLLGRPVGWHLALAGTVLFPPALLCLLQGQDAIVLLLLLLLALQALRSGSDLIAGCLLACGLFRFHLVVPLFIILAVTRKSRFAAGFAAVATILVLVCIGVSGRASLSAYPNFLLHLSYLPMAGNNPSGMANLRGIIDYLFSPFPTVAWVLLVVASLTLIVLAMWKSQIARAELMFGAAVIVALLVSYHASPHDLLLLLIPMATIGSLVRSGGCPKWWRTTAVAMVAFLFLPPLYVLLLRWQLYFLLGIPVLGLFVLLLAAHECSTQVNMRR